MKVIKKDGSTQNFNKEKIVSTVTRAGAKDEAKKIAELIEKKLKEKKEVRSGEIREIVIAELQKKSEKVAKEYAEFEKVIRKISKEEDYLENRLLQITGKNGVVQGVYGGFHILVTKEDSFDYVGVFRELLNANQSISIEKDNEKIKIISK